MQDQTRARARPDPSCAGSPSCLPLTISVPLTGAQAATRIDGQAGRANSIVLDNLGTCGKMRMTRSMSGLPRKLGVIGVSRACG